MKSVKLIALALSALAVIAAMPASAESAAQGTNLGEPVVGVGMYVRTDALDTRRFSAMTVSEGGFDFGFSDGEVFTKLFSYSGSETVILPTAEAEFSAGAESAAAQTGNIGIYAVCRAVYPGFSQALAAAGEGCHVAVTERGFELRAECPAGTPGAVWETGITVLERSSGRILFRYERTDHPFALKSASGGVVSFPMKHYSGKEYTCEYPGFFEYTVSDGMLRMVNRLGLESYTKCVMANEIGVNFSVETRKAFSVLARTAATNGKHVREGYDVCPCEACCQVYYGIFRMGEENNAIVDSTRGLIATYKGEPIAVLYHGANGGASCSSVAAWGGSEVPYLKSVFLENDEMEADSRWNITFTKSEFYDYLTSRYRFSSLADDNISMKILETDPYGSDYITVLSVSDGSGNSVRINTAERVRASCGFKSANFKVGYTADMEVLTAEGRVEKKTVSGVMTADGYKEFEGFGDSYGDIAPDKVTVSGIGSGHGVGFSATGGEKLAREGYGYKYILSFFFCDTVLTPLY